MAMEKLFCVIKVVDPKGSLIDKIIWNLDPNESLLNATERFRKEHGKSYHLGAQFIAQDDVAIAG